jgi:hypothetical protein
VFRGVPAPVDFSSWSGSRRFRTVLRAGAARGPNYAGELTVVRWGCGSPCESVAIVSAPTGRILAILQTCGGLAFRLDSRLLVADPREPDAEYPPLCATRSYRWTGQRLQSIGVPD